MVLNGKEEISTMSKIFIDTNILIYSMDNFDEQKRDNSRKLLKSLKDTREGVISTQVMQEFYVTATKKLKVDPLFAKEVMHSFEHFEVVMITPEIIKDAIDCGVLNQLSFWNSLIVSAAEHSKCNEIWTEDLNHGQVVRGVKIVNPYSS